MHNPLWEEKSEGQRHGRAPCPSSVIRRRRMDPAPRHGWNSQSISLTIRRATIRFELSARRQSVESSMATSRREFLGTAAAAAGAALVSSCTPGGSKSPPYQVTAQKDQSGRDVIGTVVSPGTSGPLAISSRLAVSSGAPLGGI